MPTHDEIVTAAIEAVQQVDREAIIAAFVGSLSTRNLPARSAFGSYVVLQHLTAHSFVDSDIFSMKKCAHCGLHRDNVRETDERIQNYPFQVRHTDIRYAAHDLATFSERPVDAPTDDDVDRLRKILDALRALPAPAQLSELRSSVQGKIKSNQVQRTIFLETFGYAGILCPKDQCHYTDDFVTFDYAASHQPANSNKRDWAYPIRFWTGSDGVNEDQIAHYFGEYL